MNPEQILELADSAIYNRPCHANASCDLGFEGTTLLCLPRHHNHQNFTPIIHLTANEMNHGMTSKRWTEIGNTLFRFYKEI